MNIMNKSLIFVAAMAALMLSYSCSDSFLEEYPDTTLSSGTFFKTKTHFDQAITAAYVGIRDIALDGIFDDEMRSDNAFFTRYANDRGPYLSVEVIALFCDNAHDGQYIYWRYSSDYRMIGRVNAILDRLDASELTDEEKKSVRAEALFLRAFYYYDLVTHWGGVPLVVHETIKEEESYIAKSTAEDVYKQVIADVSESINLGIPEATTFPQSGHATLGAAKMLRAYAYMSQPVPDYPAAEKDLKDITKMHYKLLDNYEDVFKKTNKNNQESILEAQYIEDGSTENYSTFLSRMIPKCDNPEFLTGGPTYSNYAGSTTSGGWCVPTQEMVDSYEEGDVRLEASIAVAEGTLNASDQFVIKAVKSPVRYTPISAEGMGYRYFVKKYWHAPYAYAGRTDDNFPIYRYSGALLLLSECLVNQNKNDEALPYINLVRKRAGLSELTSVTKQNVLDEERHELAFENHRYTDLIRNGVAVDVLRKHGENMKAIYSWVYSYAFDVTEDKLLFAFPYYEMELNKKLVQNPGYSSTSGN